MSGRARRAHKKKRFLTEEEICQLKQLHEKGWKPQKIAARFNITKRHVKDLLKNNAENVDKKYTHEENQIIIQKVVNENITSPAEIKKFLPNKALYMVRNQIKKLQRRGLLDKSTYPMVGSMVLNTDEMNEDVTLDDSGLSLCLMDLDCSWHELDIFFNQNCNEKM